MNYEARAQKTAEALAMIFNPEGEKNRVNLIRAQNRIMRKAARIIEEKLNATSQTTSEGRAKARTLDSVCKLLLELTEEHSSTIADEILGGL